MDRLAEIVTDVRAAFERVHREQFLGDPVANPRLAVDVLDPAMVQDTPTVVLLTPWTINGLAFPPDDVFPEELEIAGRHHPVFRVEIGELTAFRSVNLPPEPSSMRSMAQARQLALSWAGPFRAAVGAARPGHAADGGTGPDPPAAGPRLRER
jgi:hypothetical protein